MVNEKSPILEIDEKPVGKLDEHSKTASKAGVSGNAGKPQSMEGVGAPGPTRTGDLRIRSPTLYPTELRVHGTDSTIKTGDVPHVSHFPATAGVFRQVAAFGSGESGGRFRLCGIE